MVELAPGVAAFAILPAFRARNTSRGLKAKVESELRVLEFRV